MVKSLDSLRPSKRQAAKGKPKAAPPPSSPYIPDNTHRNLGWVFVGITAGVILVAWIILAKANVIFPKPDSEGAQGQPGGISLNLKGFFDDVRRFFSREQEGAGTNTDIKALEEKIFPQFTNQP